MERRGFLFCLAALLLGGIYVLSPFLQTVIVGIAIVVLFDPLHKKYLQWMPGRTRWAALLSVSSVVLLLLIPIAIILTLLTSQLTQLIEALSMHHRDPSIASLLAQLQQTLALHHVPFDLFGLNVDLVPLVRQGMEIIAKALARYSPHLVEDTFGLFMRLAILIIVLFYLFAEGHVFFRTVIRLSPMKDRYDQQLAKQMRITIHGVFYGSFLTALLQSLLSTASFYLIGVDAFLVWGTLIFFMSFLPLIGTGAIFFPLILILFFQGETSQAVLVAFCGLVIGSIDNLLRPLLIRSNVHPLMLFLGIFGGLATFGPVGLLFGPMLMASLTATLRIYEKDFA